jgi:protein-L-isoaspartate(D-aspartate) O-methyltransferase
LEADRERLLSELRAAGVEDERVLGAVAAVPRPAFVGAERRAEGWSNRPLPIGGGQTISQPLVVARMCVLLDVQPGDRVLDVGTGSGYHAALLAELGGEVLSVERDPALSALAGRNLEAAGYGARVERLVGDGALGVPERAPFDAINVAAAARGIPPALEAQLAPGGRLVTPVGARNQRLVLVRRGRDGGLSRERLDRVRFVPLV